ncbi:MAG: PIN domain-containing protein [bacterium]
MKDKAFIDTNVLIYLYSEDETEKRQVAENLVDNSPPIISIQVLNEISNVMVKKLKLAPKAISRVIEELSRHCMVREITVDTIQSALKIAEKYRYSYYDSLIVASALEDQCKILYSEDMQSGQYIEDQLRITNPFL